MRLTEMEFETGQRNIGLSCLPAVSPNGSLPHDPHRDIHPGTARHPNQPVAAFPAVKFIGLGHAKVARLIGRFA
jgi:hypothetical protein